MTGRDGGYTNSSSGEAEKEITEYDFIFYILFLLEEIERIYIGLGQSENDNTR